MFDEVIDVTANLADRMYPEFDTIAKNLFIQKIYKEIWGIKRNEYPPYIDVIKKGLQYGVYDKEILDTFSLSEIEELGNYIKQERDFNIGSYLGITVFMSKYSLKYTKNKNLELPQHTFMRIAINAFWKEKENRLEKIKTFYDMLSNFYFTRATPYYLNSLTPNRMLASCVLTAMEDDSFSINQTCHNIGIYSKFGGGTACDVSPIRSVGAVVAKRGKSSGKIPFIKMIESVITSFNQLGSRPGACCVYFNWWDYEVEDLLMLKDEGGTEDKRARKLQFAVKINKTFIERVLNDEEIVLLDPKDARGLLEATGEEFDELYKEYEQKGGIRKKRVKAREIAYLIAKIRNETGNLYIFFDDNANNQTPFNEYINSSNLCTEIFLPSRGPVLIDNDIVEKWSDNKPLISTTHDGLISLCNLSSITITEWTKLSDKKKENVTYMLLRAHDNEIDTATYPVKEGEIGNKLNRPIGIGVSSLAVHFAKNGIKFSDEDKALKEMFNVMEDITWNIYNASNKLAQERGKFKTFEETKWAKGWLPIDEFKELFEKYATDEQKVRWEELRNNIKKFGLRFVTHIAIAPTATSSLILPEGSEGIEPVKQLIATKTGTYTCKQFVPNIRKWGLNYEIAWDIPNEKLLKLAQIRQIFIDQGQSINTYTKNPHSAYETFKDIVKAERLGLKSLYYLNMPKGEIEVCENCQS